MPVCNYLKRGLRYIIKGIPEKNIRANIAYLLPNQRLIDKRIVVHQFIFIRNCHTV